MSITKILTTKNTADSVKLRRVAAVVKSARKAYGNLDVDVAEQDVDTTDGSVAFRYLSPESKVRLLLTEVGTIRTLALESCRNNSALNISKILEAEVATSSLLCNIGTTEALPYV